MMRGPSDVLRPDCCLGCDGCGFLSSGRRGWLWWLSWCWMILRISVRCYVWQFLGVRILLGFPQVVTIPSIGVSIGCFHRIRSLVKSPCYRTFFPLLTPQLERLHAYDITFFECGLSMLIVVSRLLKLLLIQLLDISFTLWGSGLKEGLRCGKECSCSPIH